MKARREISTADHAVFWRNFWTRAGCVIAAFVALTYLSFGQTDSATGEKSSVGESSYAPVLHFDSTRDAAADIRAALVEAQKTGKRVLLDIGGDWCRYCKQMDHFYQENPEIRRLRDDSFITVNVFYGPENKNEKVLSHYPKVQGIPHLFVLEKDGSVLHSQHMLELRSHGEYDAEKMKQFLLKWVPLPVDGTTGQSSSSKKRPEGPR